MSGRKLAPIQTEWDYRAVEQHGGEPGPASQQIAEGRVDEDGEPRLGNLEHGGPFGSRMSVRKLSRPPLTPGRPQLAVQPCAFFSLSLNTSSASQPSPRAAASRRKVCAASAAIGTGVPVSRARSTTVSRSFSIVCAWPSGGS